MCVCVVSLAYCCDLIDSQTSREERMSAERADCKLCGQPSITLSQSSQNSKTFQFELVSGAFSWKKKKKKTVHGLSYLMLSVY